MFLKVVTHADGDTATETACQSQALRLLRAAVRRNYRVEATRSGGAIVERNVYDGRSVVPRTHTVTLEPVTPVGTITSIVRGHLADITATAYRIEVSGRPFQSRVGRISTRQSIPPATAARLVTRGLVVLGEPYDAVLIGYHPEVRRPVRVSLAACLAVLAQDHRTHTIAPAGYVHPADTGLVTAGVQTPGGGLVYSRTSAAGCSCGAWSATGDGRDDARRLARKHRQQQTGEFIRALA